jgi:hypothetical protein
MERIIHKVAKNKDKIHSSAALSDWQSNVSLHHTFLEKIKTNTFHRNFQENRRPIGPEAQKWYDQIDQLYAPLLRNQQFENMPIKDSRTRGEKMGAEYLYTALLLGYYVRERLV